MAEENKRKYFGMNQKEETKNYGMYFGMNLWNKCSRAAARYALLGPEVYIREFLTEPSQKYRIPSLEDSLQSDIKERTILRFNLGGQ